MLFKYIISLIMFSLLLINVGTSYAISPQKSTIITINGEDVNKPLVCSGDLACELRNAEINFILRNDSNRVTVFNREDVTAACEAGWRAGVDVVVVTLNANHTCSR